MAVRASIALYALLTVAKASAATPPDAIPIRVELDAPAGCSSVDAFYAGVVARSERIRRAAAGEEAVRLGVRVTRAGGKVHGELRVLDGRPDLETRRVEGVRCDEVVEVLSLTAALALDPTARLGPSNGSSSSTTGSGATSAPPPAPPAAPPSPPPAPPPAPSPPESAPPAATVRRSAQPPLEDRGPPRTEADAIHFALGLQAIGARVLSPTVSFGGALSLRVARHRPDGAPRSVELAAVYLTNDPWSPDDEVVARWAAAAATVCPGLGLAGSRVAVDLCAQAVGGWLRVKDRVVSNPQSAGRFWGSLGAMARLGIPIGGGFSLEAELTLGIPLVERRFITTTPEETVGTTPPVAVAGGIGVARNF
jgi:hypothetical protein